MKCPFCGVNDDKVIDSRAVKDGMAIRRRRECNACGKRFTTYEYIEMALITVVKRDDKRETYDRNKLINGIRTACRKRPVSEKDIEQIVDDVENMIFHLPGQEIPSSKIGEIVMESLKKLDKVSYIRFASVYREFKDASEFVKELENLQKESKEENGE